MQKTISFHWKPLSQKQQRVLNWWAPQSAYSDYEGIIADGSIRSGKTISMGFSFVLWGMTCFNGQKFAMCGKTISALRRNVLGALKQQLFGRGYEVTEHRADNYWTVTRGDRSNDFYFFGGKDEASQDTIQGITLAGAFFDEVALMPQSFVNQATGRCSVTGSKWWFNCNPESPEHWFYTGWLLKARSRRLVYLHFTMDDNLTLDTRIKERYQRQFSGVFYQRYILGRWVAAEGLVYPFFSANQDAYLFHGDASHIDGQFYVSIDYGTHNPCSMGLWVIHNGKALRIKESYFDSRKERVQRTDEEHYAALERLTKGYYVQAVCVDPSAASFIETIRRHGKYQVIPANNDVLNGIRCVASLMQAGLLTIHESCADARREFGAYSWDDKAKEDRVIKENDHAMDDIRYFCYTIFAPLIRWADWRQK